MRHIIALVGLSLATLAARADNGTNSLWHFAAGLSHKAEDAPPPIALSGPLI